MSDYSELKSLLEYAIGYRTDKTTAPDVQKFCRLTELTTPESVLLIVAENESLRADAERYRWLRDAKGLSLRSDGSKWTRSNGDQFICSHHLCAFDTSYAPFESLDEVVDAAISYPENPS